MNGEILSSKRILGLGSLAGQDPEEYARSLLHVA
jgi:hypothetical protein